MVLVEILTPFYSDIFIQYHIVGEKQILVIYIKFRKILMNYSLVNKENFAGNEIVKIITKDMPSLIGEKLNLDINKFYVKDSGGNGQPAEVPWILIFISGDAMDLTYEEKAFFDVLTADPEVIAAMDNDILIKIAKDLTKTVKENLCPAWHERKQAQAKMRMKIKKLLNKYDYPPNKSEKALEDVMEQVTLQCVAGL